MSEQKGNEGEGVGWVYYLKKKEAEDELHKRDIEFSESLKLDDLRKLLASAVRKEIDQSTSSKVKQKENKDASEDSRSAGNTVDDDQSENESVTSCASEMASEEGKLIFCLKDGDWNTFVERLEIFFLAKDVKTEKKAVTLLTKLDEEAFILVRNLCSPAKPVTKKYEELVKIMSDHLNPKPSEVMERCVFNQAKQETSETIAEFAARLKKLSLNCGFNDLSTALRDQLVCGIRDEDTRIQLFKEENLTFDKAMQEAVARERAVINAASSHQTLEKSSTKNEMYALSVQQGRGKKKSHTQRTQNSVNSKAKNHVKQEECEDNEAVKCFCCGKLNHRARSCRHRYKSCTYCKRRGHIEAACRAKSPKATLNHMDSEPAATSKASTNNASDLYSEYEF